MIAGFVFRTEAFLAHAPRAVAFGVTIGLVVTMLLALLAFATREYLLAPRIESIARLMEADKTWLKWRFLVTYKRHISTTNVDSLERFSYLRSRTARLLQPSGQWADTSATRSLWAGEMKMAKRSHQQRQVAEGDPPLGQLPPPVPDGHGYRARSWVWLDNLLGAQRDQMAAEASVAAMVDDGPPPKDPPPSEAPPPVPDGTQPVQRGGKPSETK